MGKSAFDSARYQQASELFASQLSLTPQDPLAHYYLGLSYHCLAHYPEAAREYNWVLLNTQDPELIKRVQLGLQSLAKQPCVYAAPFPFPAAGTTPSPGSGQAAPLPGYPDAAVAAAAANGPRIGPTGQCRIVDCYTHWCGWCKKFEPLLNKAESAYVGRITFERVDAEAPDSAAFVAAYRVQAYPTILFFNPQGQLVKKIDGAPQKYEDFRRQILAAFPSLH